VISLTQGKGTTGRHNKALNQIKKNLVIYEVFRVSAAGFLAAYLLS
jgi:hypothetical protein